jgi:hypothetical protein
MVNEIGSVKPNSSWQTFATLAVTGIVSPGDQTHDRRNVAAAVITPTSYLPQ